MGRQIGMLHPTDDIPLVPDTVSTFNMTGGASAQASDWFSSSLAVAAANAAAAGVGIVRVCAFSSAGAPLPVGINFSSTNALAPTSGTSVSSGIGNTIQMNGNARLYQIPGDSTGYSVSAASSGTVVVEHWRK